MLENYGFEENEICNRNGCKGIIEQHETERSCSCHISPPCSVCVDDRHFCPECDWQALDDQKSVSSTTKYSAPPFLYKTTHQKLLEMDHSKIDWVAESHTNSSMKKIGKCPLNANMSEVFEEVKGTFGGRFESFSNGKFTFIAYTD